MTASGWLDLVAKVSEIVGAMAGVLALAFDVAKKEKAEAARQQALEVSENTPRGWLRLSAALFCVPLITLSVRALDAVGGRLGLVLDILAALAGIGACGALAIYVVSLRRMRIPLPYAIAVLLDRQSEEAQFHRYDFTVGSAPPLLDIYVAQQSEQLPPSPMVIGDAEQNGRLTLAQMLKMNRNAVLLAEPGLGKSTAVAYVLREQSAWWRAARRSARSRDAPYGPVVPISIPADLHGRNSLPAAMATECERLTGAVPPERMFERPPPFAEAWLVLIDGIDQILDTRARNHVLSRLAEWASDLSAPYRFMITSRPLLGRELGVLSSESIGYFRLLRFDDSDLREFALQWASFRKSHRVTDVEVAPITAEQFLAAVHSTPLSALARIPLIATITALVLERNLETAMPTSRASLYERYIQHLLTSRHLDEILADTPTEFAAYGAAGEEAWAWLRGNLRRLLEGTADLNLHAQARSVAECARDWSSTEAPPGLFDVVPGWHDALGTLLIATSLIVPGSAGLRFAHLSFEEYLAAGPRAKRPLEIDTWLADAQSQDSQNLALFILARQSAEFGPVADSVVELLVQRGGTDMCIAGKIIADGIGVAPELRQQVIDDLFDYVARDDLDTGAALDVLIDLTVDRDVWSRLTEFMWDQVQPAWVRADAAEKLSMISRTDGIDLLRGILHSTDDAWLRYRISLKLARLGVATAEEQQYAADYGELADGPVQATAAASPGVRAGEWYRQVAEDNANSIGERLRALLAMAQRADQGWRDLFETLITDSDLAIETRMEFGRRITQVAEADGAVALRAIAERTELPDDTRVPLLSALAEVRDEWARQVLNELVASGGASFADRFPQIMAWREEIGTRSSELPDAAVRQNVVAGRDSYVAAGNDVGVLLRSERAEVEDQGTYPRVWGGVPPRHMYFTGREGALAWLRDWVAREATVRSPRVLTGLVGIGKTQIAIEYAYRSLSRYDVVWWIPADQKPLVKASLAALAPYLGLATPASMGIEGTVVAVIDALRRGEPWDRWLLIFDNADEPEDLRQLIPGGPGDVLITSRNPRWAGLAETLPLDVFTRTESIAFLIARLPRGITNRDASRLAEELGHLPLALEQAAALQAETGISADEYLSLLKGRTSQILSESAPSEYPVPMTAAWHISVARLRQVQPDALELLRCCAFLGPEPIPRDIFRKPADTAEIEIGNLLSDPIALSRALRDLGRFALVTIDHLARTVTVHRLIQALIRDDLPADEQTKYRRQAQRILTLAAPGDPEAEKEWPRYEALLPHLKASGIQAIDDDTVRQFAVDAAIYLCASGHPSDAEEVSRSLLARWPERGGDQLARYALGRALRDLGRYTEARSVVAETYTQSLRALGEDDPVTARLASLVATLRP